MRYTMPVLGGTFKVSPVLHSARTLRVRQRPRARMQSRAFYLAATMENWRDIPGYDGRYRASNLGRIKAIAKTIARKSTDCRKAYVLPEKILAQGATFSGHMTVHLARNLLYVHRVILIAFVGPAEKYALDTRVECRHLDGNPRNNALVNLAWGTVRENRADRRRLGEKAKLTKDQMLALQTDIQSGMLVKDAAAKYGIERHTVARYRDGYMYA